MSELSGEKRNKVQKEKERRPGYRRDDVVMVVRDGRRRLAVCWQVFWVRFKHEARCWDYIGCIFFRKRGGVCEEKVEPWLLLRCAFLLELFA